MSEHDAVLRVYCSGDSAEWNLHDVEVHKFEPSPPADGFSLLDVTNPGTEDWAGRANTWIAGRTGTVLLDPWLPGFDFATPDTIRGGTTVLFAPLAFEPAFLELRRLVARGKLGDPAGIEIRHNNRIRVAEALYATALIFGKPAGWRPSEFLWFENLGCTIVLDDTSQESTWTVACRQGTVRASIGASQSVSVFPAGNPGYRLPLPDGDGVYYNRKDAIRIAVSNNPSQAFPVESVIDAFYWVQEHLNEGA